MLFHTLGEIAGRNPHCALLRAFPAEAGESLGYAPPVSNTPFDPRIYLREG